MSFLILPLGKDPSLRRLFPSSELLLSLLVGSALCLLTIREIFNDPRVTESFLLGLPYNHVKGDGGGAFPIASNHTRSGDTSRSTNATLEPFEMSAYRQYYSNEMILPGGSTTTTTNAPLSSLSSTDNDMTPSCEVWAVLMSTSDSPSKLVHQLAAIHDVCVCVVAADKDSPSVLYHELDSVVYLTTEIQVSRRQIMF